MKKILSTIVFTLALSIVGAFGFNITDNGTFPTTAQTPNAVAYIDLTPGKEYVVEIVGATFDSGSIEVELYRGGAWDTLATKDAITAAEGFQLVTGATRVRFVVTSVAGAAADIDIFVTLKK